MKKTFLILILILGINGNISAERDSYMIPLMDYVSKNSMDDLNNFTYLNYRCAGLFSMQISTVSSRTDQKAIDVLKTLNERLDKSYKLGFLIYLKNNKNATNEEFDNSYRRSVQPIVDNYQIIANQSWVKNGEYFSDPLIRSDTQVCVELLDF